MMTDYILYNNFVSADTLLSGLNLGNLGNLGNRVLASDYLKGDNVTYADQNRLNTYQYGATTGLDYQVDGAGGVKVFNLTGKATIKDLMNGAGNMQS